MKSFSISTKISGSFYTRLWIELFSNSGYFPIINSIFEILLEGTAYFRTPNPYNLLLGSIVQSYWLTRWQMTSRPRQILGNLIGPALYSSTGIWVEGIGFFDNFNHWLYWLMGLMIGILQELRVRLNTRFIRLLLIIENVVRMSTMLVMYAVFDTHVNSAEQTLSLESFFSEISHTFITLAVLLTGLIIGLANLTVERYLGDLKNTSVRLHRYSEWLFGRDLLEKSFTDPSIFRLTQRERFVIFMDIRSFTHWSEKQPLDHVAKLLNRYYEMGEAVFSGYNTVKFKFCADEMMAVFSTAESAVQAALELSRRAKQLLASEYLGAGCGLHGGLLIEGLFGSTNVRFYDAIGDTVNTAQRISAVAQSGEVLISESIRQIMGDAIKVGSAREITVKGKTCPLIVYSLHDTVERYSVSCPRKVHPKD